MRIITLTLFFILAQSCFSQDILKGKVIGMDDNLYLPMVMVINESTRDTVQTDMEGIFSIKVEIGHNLIFRYLGYVPRSYTVKDLDFLTIGIKPDCNCDDFGWNRIYFGPNYDLNNNLFGIHLDYSSDPLIGTTILNPKFKAHWGAESQNIDAKLGIESFVSNSRTRLSAYFRYQNVEVESIRFENFTASLEAAIFNQYISIGASNSRYMREGNTENGIGVLLGYWNEISIAKRYFELDLNTVIWNNDIEVNLEISHKFSTSIRAGLQFQHYRDFNQLSLAIAYSLRLEKPYDRTY